MNGRKARNKQTEGSENFEKSVDGLEENRVNALEETKPVQPWML
jgi:hypothetical protein